MQCSTAFGEHMSYWQILVGTVQLVPGWRKSCTTLYTKYPGIHTRNQWSCLVQDFRHPPYVSGNILKNRGHDAAKAVSVWSRLLFGL